MIQYKLLDKFQFCELFLNMLTHKCILRNGNPSGKKQRFWQLPLHKGGFGMAEICTHFFFLGQAEHPAGCPGPHILKLADQYDLPVVLCSFSLRTRSKAPGGACIGDYSSQLCQMFCTSSSSSMMSMSFSISLTCSSLSSF